MYYTSGETIFGDFRNSLRAYEPVTGRLAWSHDYLEPYGINARYPGVLVTSGGLVFTGDVSGNLVAFDAKSGAILWHDELPETVVTNAPISYVLDGKQYVVVGTGDRLVAYTLK
jgi:alcohol dehydrogenase (cytochrome c)